MPATAGPGWRGQGSEEAAAREWQGSLPIRGVLPGVGTKKCRSARTGSYGRAALQVRRSGLWGRFLTDGRPLEPPEDTHRRAAVPMRGPGLW
jgi:hypothetical protein